MASWREVCNDVKQEVSNIQRKASNVCNYVKKHHRDTLNTAIGVTKYLGVFSLGVGAGICFHRYVYPHRFFFRSWWLSHQNHAALGYCTAADKVLRRRGYAVGFSYKYKTAMWASFYLSPESIQLRKEIRAAGLIETEVFSPDKKLASSVRTSVQDYTNTGYDKGHMAPRASVGFCRKSSQESFLLSNVSLQHPKLNRGTWKRLEWCTRRWAESKGTLGVVVGTVFAGTEDTLKVVNGITVPTHFYMVLLHMDTLEGIGFLVKNDETGMTTSLRKSLVASRMSIAELEERVRKISKRRISFFTRLPSPTQVMMLYKQTKVQYNELFWELEATKRVGVAAGEKWVPVKKDDGAGAKGKKRRKRRLLKKKKKQSTEKKK